MIKKNVVVEMHDLYIIRLVIYWIINCFVTWRKLGIISLLAVFFISIHPMSAMVTYHPSHTAIYWLQSHGMGYWPQCFFLMCAYKKISEAAFWPLTSGNIIIPRHTTTHICSPEQLEMVLDEEVGELAGYRTDLSSSDEMIKFAGCSYCFFM